MWLQPDLVSLRLRLTLATETAGIQLYPKVCSQPGQLVVYAQMPQAVHVPGSLSVQASLAGHVYGIDPDHTFCVSLSWRLTVLSTCTWVAGW